jgi:hypothetical protein
MEELLAQFGALLQGAWESVEPAATQLWKLITTDPKSALAALVIICFIIWAYQESSRLGR